MQLFHHRQSVREAIRQARAQGQSIGFVPTMGNLHEGHLSLIERVREEADYIVTSIFVNRLQFGLNEDWDRYPRTFEADAQQLTKSGCDVLFYPDEHEMYPNGMDEQTRVVVPSMSDILCGASRPGHFEGVTTVVTKLFNIIQPDVAVFGIKDFQQLAIIRRMVEDLCIPVRVLGAEISREDDGLARSSRNHFISEEERPKANQLFRTLHMVKDKIAAGERDYQMLELQAAQLIRQAGFRADYVTICQSKTLEKAAVDDSDITILGAMYTQNARLIDNVSLVLQ